MIGVNRLATIRYDVKKGSPYSIAERGVPELGSQPTGDVSHKPGGRLPLLSATFTFYFSDEVVNLHRV